MIPKKPNLPLPFKPWPENSAIAGCVTRPSFEHEAMAWSKENLRGRLPRKEELSAWFVHAERVGLSKTDASRGAEVLTKTYGSGDTLDELRRVFEGAMWGAYSTPNELQIQMGAQSTGFGFGTRVAELIWAKAVEVAAKNPTWDVNQVISQATREAEVSFYEITPEDVRTLEMAIQWARAGQAPNQPKP